MNSAPKPLLLGLPAELRLHIYQYFWSIPQEGHILPVPQRYDPYQYLHDQSKHVRHLKVSYLKAQLTAISTLGAICQKIRYEAYAEYFDTTQIYLGWGFFDFMNMESFFPHDKQAMELIRTSYLLQTQARHICLHWADVPPWEPELGGDSVWMPPALPARYRAMTRMVDNHRIAMECLETRFTNAITLEVLCDVACDEEFWLYHRQGLPVLWPFIATWDSRGEMYYGSWRSQRIRALPFRGKLQKAVVHALPPLSPPFNVYRAKEVFGNDNYKEKPWFRMFKEDVASLVAPKKVLSIPYTSQSLSVLVHQLTSYYHTRKEKKSGLTSSRTTSAALKFLGPDPTRSKPPTCLGTNLFICRLSWVGVAFSRHYLSTDTMPA